MKLTVLFTLWALSAWAQPKQTNVQVGTCNQVANENKGTITINCTSIDPKLMEEMKRTTAILDRLAKRKADPSMLNDLRELNRKMDEVLSAVNTELERVKQEEAPRHLTETEKAELAKSLGDQPKGRFTIKANITAKDARGYADEIAAFFNDPKIGWTVKVDNAIITGPNVVGMWITVRDRNTVPQSAAILQNALQAAHLPSRAELDPTGPAADEVWLSIGLKN